MQISGINYWHNRHADSLCKLYYLVPTVINYDIKRRIPLGQKTILLHITKTRPCDIQRFFTAVKMTIFS